MRARRVHRRGSVPLTIAVVVSFLVVGCAGGSDTSDPNEVVGVVSQVSGAGETVDGFVIVDDGGTSHAFVPGDGVTCDGQPLDHLRTHLVDRDRVSVSFDGSSSPPTATTIRHVEG